MSMVSNMGMMSIMDTMSTRRIRRCATTLHHW
jgi:hypothetical protein